LKRTIRVRACLSPGSVDDVMKMVDREKSILWTAHPRTKSSAMYPDMYKDQDFFFSDRFIGES